MPESPKATASLNVLSFNDRPPMKQINYIELCRRPLRKAVPKPQGEKRGKSRLRGRGVPPPSGLERQYQPSKVFVPGRSFASSMGEVIRHPQEKDDTLHPVHTSVRITERSHNAHLSGSCLKDQSTDKPYKPSKRVLGPPIGTRTGRVLGLRTVNPDDTAPTYALFGGPTGQDVYVSSRPGTAPVSVLFSEVGMRSGYATARSAYDDVVKYRHSGGICPPEYKMIVDRNPAPHLGSPGTHQARTCFMESKNSYQANKMRSRGNEIL